MPRLPSSRRRVILGAGLSNATQFVSSTVKVMPVEYTMSGSARFAITIDKEAKVETPARGAMKPDAAPVRPSAPSKGAEDKSGAGVKVDAVEKDSAE